MSGVSVRKINDEVFVAADDIVKLGAAEVAFVKSQALQNGRQRARICTHKSDDDALHEMLIAITPASYIHPHKHAGKSESFHIVEGAVDIVVFDDDGRVSEIVELREAGKGVFFYRLARSSYHTLLVKSSVLVVHEVTNGPFSRDGTTLAAWAPQEGDVAETIGYMKRVAELARNHNVGARVGGA